MIKSNALMQGKGRVAMVAGGVALLIGAGVAMAQDKKPPAKGAPAAAPATTQAAPANAAGAPAQEQPMWVKLCGEQTLKHLATGKEEKKQLCLTHHERLDPNMAMTIVSAAVRTIQGEPKQEFMVMVNTGAGLVIKDDIVVKFEKDTDQEATRLKYEMCQPTVCQASIELTPALLEKLKTQKGFVVVAMNAGKQPMGFPVPLTGFAAAFAGQPADPKAYSEARKQVMTDIAKRHRQELDKNPELAKAVKEAEEAQKKVGAQIQQIQKQQADKAGAAAPAQQAPAQQAPKK